MLAPEPGAPGPVLARRLVQLALAAAVLPIAVAAARAVLRGWLPVGDNAYFAIRARDVLTEHHPMLGTWTSASLTAGVDFNNPGGLLFAVLALPVRASGGGAGLAVGVALLNAAAVIGTIVVARRVAGALGATLAAATVAALAWSMGSELLFEPWQPHSLLLPFVFFLALIWALLAGDARALPWAVVVASLVVQTHLSYVVLVGVLALVGVAGFVARVRRERRSDNGAWPARRVAVTRVVVVSVIVGLACWAQPLIEQVQGGGDGNLARLAQGARAAPEALGAETGARLVATVATLPPFWFRPSFADAFVPAADGTPPAGVDPALTDLPASAAALASLATMAVLLGLAAWDARRRGDRATGAAVGVAMAATAGSLVTAASMPVGVLGIAPHQFRFLWPVAAFAWFALVLAGARRAAAAGLPPRTAAMAATVVTAAVAILGLPASNPGVGPSADAWAIPVMRAVAAEMAVLEGEGPLVVDLRGIRFAEPYSAPVMAELQRRGIPFVVRPGDEMLVRQLGESRRYRAGLSRALRIREGPAARRRHPGERLVVLHEGATDRETVGLFLGPLRPTVL